MSRRQCGSREKKKMEAAADSSIEFSWGTGLVRVLRLQPLL